MPKKYTKEDVENWSVQEVKTWLVSKKLTPCLPDFEVVNGAQLLGMTNDDLKALPSVKGNEKKRKALKKAVSQLPGNSITGKPSKSKVGSSNKPPKAPPPLDYIPQSSFEPVPAAPPLPPSSSSFQPPPLSPNSATYSDPSLVWGEEDQPQDIYDNPAEAREDILPPPLPPHPGYHQQGGGYPEEDDQMIYEQYEEGEYEEGEEEEMFDSSFASEEFEEEEEEEEEEPSAVNGLRNVNPGTEANIRAIRAKFFAEGLREYTGIQTASTPPSQRRAPGLPEVEESDGDDIYDLPPEELKLHPPPHVSNIQPPDLPPPAHHHPHQEEEEEAIDEDIYDVAEEILQPSGPSGRAPPPVPPPMEDIYEAAAADEEEQPPPLPPPSRPLVTQDNLEPTPPRPPKPGGSPALPHKATPLSLGSSRPSMRKPIGGGGGFAALRPPIQSSSEPRPPAPPTVPSVGDSRGTPPPPPAPPPPVSSQTSSSSESSSSPRLWGQKKEPPPTTNSPFASGRKFPAPGGHSSPSPTPPTENKFPRPSEMKGNRSPGGGGAPVPGKFLGRAGLRPVGAGKTETAESSGVKPAAASGKPMSIQDRIKLLNKPGGEGGEGKKAPPPKPAEGVSPCTGRKMSRDSSVSDLIKSYHSGGSSEGGDSRPMSPENKPTLPVKPPSLSPQHFQKSPQLKRRPIGQQAGPPPSLPEKRSAAAPPWKRTPSEEQEHESPKKTLRQPVPKPWQKEEEPARPWQKRTNSEDSSNGRPPWRKPGGEEPSDPRPPWRKAGGEEPSDPRPPWRKTGGEEPSDPRPPWRKAGGEEPSDPRPPWRKTGGEEPSDPRPPWRKAGGEEPSDPRPPWRKAGGEEPSDPRPPWRKAGGEEPSDPRPPWRKTGGEEPSDPRPPWRKAGGEEPSDPRPPWRKPAGEEESQPSWKRPPAESPPPESSPGPSRQSFTYKPYKASKSTAKPDTVPELPPPRQRETQPPPEPPRPTTDRLKSRFPAPDNAPPELPGRGNNPPPEPPRPSFPAERSRFRAPDVPVELPRPRPPGRNDVPPELPRMANNGPRGRVLPPPEEEDQPRLPPRPPKLPDRPLPTPSSQPGPELPHRPWQRPPLPEPVDLPPRPPKTQATQPAPSSGSPVGHTWYHANLKDRKVAESRLLQHPRDGTFIIRDSSRTAGEYSLSIVYHGAVKHLRIRLRTDGQFVLGEEKADEVTFASVVELVTYHKKEPLVLKSGGNVLLRYECPR